MKKYFVNEKEVSENLFRDKLEEETRKYVEKNYDDILDECYEKVKIDKLEFTPSEVIKNCSPGDYEIYKSEEINYEVEDNLYTINDQGSYSINEVKFSIVE